LLLPIGQRLRPLSHTARVDPTLGVEPSLYCDEKRPDYCGPDSPRGHLATTPTPAAMTKLYPNG